MYRVGLWLLAALLATTSSAFAEGAYTTRIEPRPFYGATVSLEAGVRVFRPLPPHRHIIINPGHRTPLNLTFKDVKERRYIRSENYHNYSGGPAHSGYGAGWPGYVGAYGHGGRKYGRHVRRGGDGIGRRHYRGHRGGRH